MWAGQQELPNLLINPGVKGAEQRGRGIIWKMIQEAEGAPRWPMQAA